MTFWEVLTVAGLVATVMGVFLTIYGIVNNKTLKAESQNTRDILSRIEQGHSEARKEMAEAIRYLAELIKVESQATREAMRTRA